MPDADTATPPTAPASTRPAPPAPAGRRSRARVRFNQGMRWVRRAHLYTGLFMTPWVFLYGISGMLFNHPDRFADQSVTRFGPAETRGGPLAGGVRAEAVAGRVLDALETPGADAYRLVRPGEAAFGRDLFALVTAGGQNYSVRVDLEGGRGSLRFAEPPDARIKRISPPGGIKLDPPPFAAVSDALPGVFGRLGLKADSVSIRNPPDVSFLAERGGAVSRITYSPTSGAVTARPADVPGPLSLRRFLILLHVAHEFPARINARWFWAIAVDLMFVSMVGWGFTGLLMWWQMKNVRAIGVAVLIASAIAATALGLGMHQILTV